MAHKVRKVCYFRTTVMDRPGEAHKVLSSLADIGINLLAFTAVPVGSNQAQLSLFPDDDCQIINEAKKVGMTLDGPHHALMVTGDDELGAFSEIHAKLAHSNVNVFASSGLTDGRGSYGYLLYLRSEDLERAEHALGI